MNTALPPVTGVELGRRHPHMGGLEAQPLLNNTRGGPGNNMGAAIPAGLASSIENLGRSQIEQTRVAGVGEGATEYNFNRKEHVPVVEPQTDELPAQQADSFQAKLEQ